MAGKITVDPARLEQAAQRLGQQAEEYIKLVETIYSDVDTMGAAWKGADNQAFAGKVNAFRSEFGVALKSMASYSEFLIGAAKSYRETQQGVAGAASSLPTGPGGGGGGGRITFPGFPGLGKTLPFPMYDMARVISVVQGWTSGGSGGAADVINISLGEVTGCAQRLRSSSGNLDGKLREIQTTMASIGDVWESDAADTVRARFNATVNKVSGYRQSVDSYAGFLDRTVSDYQQTENKIRSSAEGMA